MLKKKTYRIESYERWNETFVNALSDFMSEFQLLPHIVVSNEGTSERIGQAMEGDGAHPELAAVYPLMWSFLAAIDSIEFCVRDDLTDEDFVLVYDDDARFSDED
jgi:hypothetical protein